MFEVDELGLDELVLEPHATATIAIRATTRYFTATKPTDVENLGVDQGNPASTHGFPGAEADQGGKPDGQYGAHDQRC